VELFRTRDTIIRRDGRAMERADIPPNVLGVVGCYSVDLICGHPRHDADYGDRMREKGGPGDVPHHPIQFIGETRGECLNSARKHGWYISRDEQRVLCPYHAKQVKR
jgi:hypothetical protein